MASLTAAWLTRARFVSLGLASLFLCACGSLRYYGQAVRGQSELLIQQRAVTRVIQDPATPPPLAARLQLALQARRFATQQLALPDNRSYTRYVQLHRPYVVWNVFATPRYSVDAVQHCFPIAGCVGYRGWFKESAARADAARLRARGDDVWVGGVSAYSTLGWFADPIVSSMLGGSDDELSSTIFHELAHQLIYVKGDTAFNESFATFVQMEGLRQWRQSRELPVQDDHARTLDDDFTRLVLDLRKRLEALYASRVDEISMAAGKQREIDAFRARFRQWQQRERPATQRFQAWVAQPINNARLLPFGLYDQWTPAFTALFRRAGGHWAVFYASVRTLARQPVAQRDSALQALLDGTD